MRVVELIGIVVIPGLAVGLVPVDALVSSFAVVLLFVAVPALIALLVPATLGRPLTWSSTDRSLNVFTATFGIILQVS